MSRARYLKPTFFTNERVGELPPLHRLAYQGLWCHADREGRLKDRPKSLRIEILPYDDCDFDAILGALQEAGFIVRYEVSGERFIWLPAFLEHQHPHPKEAASTLPAPPNQPSGIHEPTIPDASTMHEPSMNQPSGMLPGSLPSLTESESIKESESESESESARPRGEPAARGVRHKPVDEAFIAELQAEHPTVNVTQVYERAQNRKTWDGYKDKRRALRDHVGYAIEDQRRTSNGRNNHRPARDPAEIAGLADFG